VAKNWRNSGFVAKFLTEFALFDERKVAFLVAKFFGAYSYGLTKASFFVQWLVFSVLHQIIWKDSSQR